MMRDPVLQQLAQELLSTVSLSLGDLAEMGIGRHRANALISDGALIRLRRGRYVRAGVRPGLRDAVALGGRLDCVSLLLELGVFVRGRFGLRIQLDDHASRVPRRPREVVAHWRPSVRRREHLTADIIEALAQACRCQSPRDAVATLDSAWHLGLIAESDVAEIFRRLPARMQFLRAMLDPRSESGAESIMRLILRSIDAHVDVQVVIPRVGRVDFVVDGWLIIECDSRAHHAGWDAQKRDRRRDIAAARLGFTTIRPIAEDIFDRRDLVRADIVDALAHRPRKAPRNSGRSRQIDARPRMSGR